MNRSKEDLLRDSMARVPRQSDVIPKTIEVTERRFNSRSFSSPFVLIAVFLGLVAIGTILLMAPFSHHENDLSNLPVALFTATSAVTVTGLTLVDTAEHWTKMGQFVILCLMFVGGLGFMSLAAFSLAILGQRVSIRQRLLIRESLGREELGGLRLLSISIVTTAVGIQLVGAVALFSRFIFKYDLMEAIWYSVFHSISGFNNAGLFVFSEPGGFSYFQNDPIVLMMMGVLIILGTLSYLVIGDVVTKRRFKLFSLTAKIVTAMTLILIFVSAGMFLISEGNNMGTIGSLSFAEKMYVALFESISGRTAGFTTIDYSMARPATDVFMSVMMFVGGASGSVAGGIKVTTFLVIILSILAVINERPHVSVFGREIDAATTRRSYAVLIVSFGFIIIGVFLLALTNNALPLSDVIFESVSAYGTVGLSVGTARELNIIGQLIITMMMFVGRIGPLIIGLRMVPNRESETYRSASETVTIG